MKKVIDRVKEDVEAGMPIWEVLEEIKFFPNFVISLIKICIVFPADFLCYQFPYPKDLF